MIKESALWALIRLLWSITKIPVIAHKRLWMFISNISANTWILYDLIGVQNTEDSYCSLMETIDKPVSLLSAHMNIFIVHMNTLITQKHFAKVEIYNGSQHRKWRDENRRHWCIAYLKAIIVVSSYRINGITRYQRGLAAHHFLMRISQCWIDWVRIKCKPTFNGLIMMICRAPLGDQRLIIIIIVIRIHRPPLLFRGCTSFGDWVSWAFTFRGTCPPNCHVFILFHHVFIAIDVQDAFPCCIED